MSRQEGRAADWQAADGGGQRQAPVVADARDRIAPPSRTPATGSTPMVADARGRGSPRWWTDARERLAELDRGRWPPSSTTRLARRPHAGPRQGRLAHSSAKAPGRLKKLLLVAGVGRRLSRSSRRPAWRQQEPQWQSTPPPGTTPRDRHDQPRDRDHPGRRRRAGCSRRRRRQRRPRPADDRGDRDDAAGHPGRGRSSATRRHETRRSVADQRSPDAPARADRRQLRVDDPSAAAGRAGPRRTARVARRSAQNDRIGTVPPSERDEGEAELPPRPARQREGDEHEDHVEPAVRDAEVLRDRVAEPLPVAADREPGRVHQVRPVQGQPDQAEHDEQDADDGGHHAVGGQQAVHGSDGIRSGRVVPTVARVLRERRSHRRPTGSAPACHRSSSSRLHRHHRKTAKSGEQPPLDAVEQVAQRGGRRRARAARPA